MATIYWMKCVLISLLFYKLARANSDEMCIPVRGMATGNPPPKAQQGRPGKIGARGDRGVKGEQGIRGLPGQCACEPSEVEELRSQIRLLNDSLNGFKTIVAENNPKVRVKVCSVGIRDGNVPDSAMTASSTHNNHQLAKHGRLDNIYSRSNGYAWVPSLAKYKTAGEWIQVDLQVPTYIVGVVTQGSYDNGAWITSYTIQYGNSTSSLQTIQRNNANLVFSGNKDRNTYVINNFPEPITARYFRLVVVSWHSIIALRMDLLTC